MENGSDHRGSSATEERPAAAGPVERGPQLGTSLITRSTCRVCGSGHLAPILSLGDQRIAGAFAQPGGESPIERAIPLDLVRCDMTKDERACGLVQIRHTVPAAILYRSYWYRSGVNASMTNHLHDITQHAETVAGLESGDLVIDIGCNDGTLLDGYRTDGIDRLGFDPSDVSRYALEKGYDVVVDFFSHAALQRARSGKKAKVISSIAMFYDLENPHRFVNDVAAALAPDGVWALELHYLPAMLERNAFDVIVHEHLNYYSLAVLERVVAEAGLRVLTGELNDVNGGSIRLLIGHEGGQVEASADDRRALQDLRIHEFELALDSPEPYERFARGVEGVRDELSRLCRELRGAGKEIHVYGASTKGNAILQYAGVDHGLIPYAADRNPDKWGSKTIGTDIPIISEEDSRAMKPDYYLVLPWHFLDEFVEREREFFDRGGRFIVPLPHVRTLPD